MNERSGVVVQYCTFSVESLNFAVEVERVREVLRFTYVTRVPLAPAIVGGLMNLRGDIVTAIDMRARLALPPRDAAAVAMSVVLRRTSGAVSLLVDRIGDVIEVAGDSVLGVPHTIPSSVRELTRGIIPWQRELLLLLDTTRAVPEDVPPKVRRNGEAGTQESPRNPEETEVSP
jgi:purine-binding chemotaxis protein CheW